MRRSTLKLSLFAVASACAAILSAPSANAALILGSSVCANTDISPTASDCAGWFVGNLNSGNATDLADSATAANTLLGTTFTGVTLPIIETLGNIGSGNTIDFGTLLFGPTLVSAHVGGAIGAGGIGYNGTGFFLLNAGTTGLDTLTLNVPGLSNARLFTTGPNPGNSPIPEPATWLMMILGFGAIGLILRRNPAKDRVVYDFTKTPQIA